MADGAYYGGNVDYDSAVIWNQICIVLWAYVNINEYIRESESALCRYCGREKDEQSTIICGNVAKKNTDRLYWKWCAPHGVDITGETEHIYRRIRTKTIIKSLLAFTDVWICEN